MLVPLKRSGGSDALFGETVGRSIVAAKKDDGVVRNPKFAEFIDASIENGLSEGGAEDVTARHRGGPTRVEVDGRTAARIDIRTDLDDEAAGLQPYYDPDGRPNMMNAAWGGICSSQPPSIAVSLRAATYSHGNIMASGAFWVLLTALG